MTQPESAQGEGKRNLKIQPELWLRQEMHIICTLFFNTADTRSQRSEGWTKQEKMGSQKTRAGEPEEGNVLRTKS